MLKRTTDLGRVRSEAERIAKRLLKPVEDNDTTIYSQTPATVVVVGSGESGDGSDEWSEIVIGPYHAIDLVPGVSYHFEVGFSDYGTFEDEHFDQVLVADQDHVEIQPETHRKSSGRASFTVCIHPDDATAGAYGDEFDLELSARLLGRGWSGESGPFAGDWSYHAIGGEISADDITAGTLDPARFSAYADLVDESKIGPGAEQVAAGNHNHDATYYRNTGGTLYGDLAATGTIRTAYTGKELHYEFGDEGTTVYGKVASIPVPTLTTGAAVEVEVLTGRSSGEHRRCAYTVKWRDGLGVTVRRSGAWSSVVTWLECYQEADGSLTVYVATSRWNWWGFSVRARWFGWGSGPAPTLYDTLAMTATPTGTQVYQETTSADGANATTEVGDLFSSGYYLGDANVDGTWRMLKSGSDFVVSRRESGVYFAKATITPSGIDHGALGGLGDNDHPQYSLTSHNHDASYAPASHATRTDNPHSVTAAQVGAAATSHTHTESQITDLDHDAEKIQGRAVSSGTPATGQVLKWNGSAWAPAADLTSDPGSSSIGVAYAYTSGSQALSTGFTNVATIDTIGYTDDISASANSGIQVVDAGTYQITAWGRITMNAAGKLGIEIYGGSTAALDTRYFSGSGTWDFSIFGILKITYGATFALRLTIDAANSTLTVAHMTVAKLR